MTTERFIGTDVTNSEADLGPGKHHARNLTPELPHDPDFDHITKWLMDESSYLEIQEAKKGGE